MKKLVFCLTFLTTIICFGETPDGTSTFVNINPYKTPLVTNVEEAVSYVMSPIGIDMNIQDWDSDIESSMTCRPNRMNVVTNNVEDLLDLDIVCKFYSNFRTGQIYFGPEYRELITVPVNKGIKIKPEGVLFNNSTNMIVITQVPAILKLTQFLGTNLWVTVEYPEFTYKKITLDSIDVDSEGIVTITGENLDAVKYSGNITNTKLIQYIVEGSTETNECKFSYVESDKVLKNSTVSKEAAWIDGKKYTFLVTTANKAFDVKYETQEISYPKTTLLSVKPFVLKEEVKKEDEEVGFFGSIWNFLTDLF